MEKTKKITSIKKVAPEHTWDLTTISDNYVLSNGCISHNTSSQVANATNGIEPPRAYVSSKQSGDGSLAQVVPEYKKLKNKYELLWDQKSPVGYLQICAVLQKYCDQSLSTNTSYNPIHYEDQKIPMSELLRDLLLCYKWGIKTLYYFNTNDQQGEIDTNEECESCKI